MANEFRVISRMTFLYYEIILVGRTIVRFASPNDNK